MNDDMLTNKIERNSKIENNIMLKQTAFYRALKTRRRSGDTTSVGKIQGPI